jgi:hypothetical protein
MRLGRVQRTTCSLRWRDRRLLNVNTGHRRFRHHFDATFVVTSTDFMDRTSTTEKADHAPAEAGDKMLFKIPALMQACELAALTAAPLFTLFGWRWHRRDNTPIQVTARDIEEHFKSAIAQILAADQLVVSESSGRLIVERYQTKDDEDVWTLCLELASFSR